MDFNTDPAAIPGLSQLQVIIGYTAWGVSALAILAVLAFGARMAIALNRHGEATKGAGKIIGGGVLIGAASSFVGTITGFNVFTSNPEAIPGLLIVQRIIGWSAWVSLGVCVIGALICGGKLVASFNEGNNEGVKNFGLVVGGCLIVGSASTIVGVII